MPNWIELGVQSVGAIVVCWMFLKHLKNRDADAATDRQLANKTHAESVERLMTYIEGRDKQSAKIAESGFHSLELLSDSVSCLKDEVKLLLQECKAIKSQAASCRPSGDIANIDDIIPDVFPEYEDRNNS